MAQDWEGKPVFVYFFLLSGNKIVPRKFFFFFVLRNLSKRRTEVTPKPVLKFCGVLLSRLLRSFIFISSKAEILQLNMLIQLHEKKKNYLRIAFSFDSFEY